MISAPVPVDPDRHESLNDDFIAAAAVRAAHIEPIGHGNRSASDRARCQKPVLSQFRRR